jgi:HNH endonuclease
MNYLSDKIRKQVWLRANDCCEYCLLHKSVVFWTHEIDHIISLKHGGSDDLTNLALACYYCNRGKGTDVGSIFKGGFYRFFNPRIDIWSDHFKLEDALIQPLTPVGEVTAKILGFNQVDRIIERQILVESGLYPKFLNK